MNVKQKVNECMKHESLTLTDIETTIMEISNRQMYSKHRQGMKVELSDCYDYKYVKNQL